MGTRQAPYNDVSLWKANFPDDDVSFGPKMNSLPHFELFNMGLHHLVEWVAIGSDEPFDTAKLRELYRDSADYLRRFESRLDELIAADRLLAEDAEDLRSEARELEIP
ncbi:alpha/beta hydrolase domain-containing protein [Streptomyces sp. NPDC000878]